MKNKEKSFLEYMIIKDLNNSRFPYIDPNDYMSGYNEAIELAIDIVSDNIKYFEEEYKDANL